MLYKSRLRTPKKKLEKIELLRILGKAEIGGYVFKGICLNTYPFIKSNELDLYINWISGLHKFFRLGIWLMFDYLQDYELLILVQGINIKNQELFKRNDKFVFAVLKQAS